MKNSGDSGHPCLIPDFRGNALFFPHSVLRLSAVGLSHMYVMLRCKSSILRFFRVLIMEGCWILAEVGFL
jgi:hypothetical protein